MTKKIHNPVTKNDYPLTERSTPEVKGLWNQSPVIDPLADEYRQAVYYAELGSPTKGKQAIDNLIDKVHRELLDCKSALDFEKGIE